MTNTTALVEGLRELYSKATPGKWASSDTEFEEDIVALFVEQEGAPGIIICADLENRDAQLIAALHNAFPQLADAIESLQRENADAKSDVLRLHKEKCDALDRALEAETKLNDYLHPF